MKNEILFYLNVEDFQNVAIQEIDRHLTKDEILKVRDKLNERINWYDALSDSINELLIVNNDVLKK
jgi:hypothetical protein